MGKWSFAPVSDVDTQNMARFNHSSVQVVKHEAFFNPTWDEEEIRIIHEEDQWDWDATGQCA